MNFFLKKNPVKSRRHPYQNRVKPPKHLGPFGDSIPACLATLLLTWLSPPANPLESVAFTVFTSPCFPFRVHRSRAAIWIPFIPFHHAIPFLYFRDGAHLKSHLVVLRSTAEFPVPIPIESPLGDNMTDTGYPRWSRSGNEMKRCRRRSKKNAGPSRKFTVALPSKLESH